MPSGTRGVKKTVQVSEPGFSTTFKCDKEGVWVRADETFKRIENQSAAYAIICEQLDKARKELQEARDQYAKKSRAVAVSAADVAEDR